MRLTREPKPKELYSEEAEQAVISAMLAEQAAITKTREMLTGESFFRPAHRRLFEAMTALSDRGEIVDPLTLTVALESAGEVESVGGRKYIGYLIDVVPTAANVEYHARIVRDFAERRSLIEIAETLAKSATDGTVPVQDAAQAASSALLPAAASLSKGGFVHIRDLIHSVADDIEAAGKGAASGFQFGFRDIDLATGGALPGEVVFVCSVPGACKTALTLNMGLAAAERGEGVAYFSAEMKDKALVKRLVSNRARVNGYSIRTGRLMDGEYVRLGEALGMLAHLPFWVDDTPEPDIALMKARARALKAKNPNLRWIIVDFIQLVLSKQDSDDGRARELGRISYALKAIAKELDCVVVATCQVDAAGIEKRSDKRPQLSDMQWSQAMRQAGDFIVLLYRPAMYDNNAQDVIETDWRKARELAPFKATLNWIGQFMRVEDIARAERTYRAPLMSI